MTQPLQQGEMLQWFRIERVLGRGGFGITYLATDTNLDHLVAIKEYAPDSQVLRGSDNSLDTVDREALEAYDIGLTRFISEARTLVKFNHPNLVRILTVFEANKTAYLVMDYEEGEIFKEYVARNYIVPERRLKEIFLKIADGLQQVHERGFLHRDIKPANIIIRKNGDPVLLDFGCARPALLEKQVTHTAFVSPGYSPLEQLHEIAGLEEGPWTDIYALSATLHFAISNKTPPNSTSRLTAVAATIEDPLIPATEVGKSDYSRPFLEAVDWGLKSQIVDRPTTLLQWREALTAHPLVSDDATVLLPKILTENPQLQALDKANSRPNDDADATRVHPVRPQLDNVDAHRIEPVVSLGSQDPWDSREIRKEPTSKPSRQGSVLPVVIGVICVALAGVGWFVVGGDGSDDSNQSSSVAGGLDNDAIGKGSDSLTHSDQVEAPIENQIARQQENKKQLQETERWQAELQKQKELEQKVAEAQKDEQHRKNEQKLQEEGELQALEMQRRQDEKKRQSDLLRQEELQREAVLRKQKELQEQLKKRQQEALQQRQEQLRIQEEAQQKLEEQQKLEAQKQQEELERQAQQRRLEDIKAQEAQQKKDEEQRRRQQEEQQRQAEERQRREELQAQENQRNKQKEQQRQEELRRQQEEQRQQEEEERDAEFRRQEEVQERQRKEQEAQLQQEKELRTVTQQEFTEAEFRLKQLARAISNRNLQAVNQLTESNPVKYGIVEALVSKSKKMDARIKNIEADNTAGRVTAILELTNIVMAGGQTFVPAIGLREHAISMQKTPAGWEKISW